MATFVAPTRSIHGANLSFATLIRPKSVHFVQASFHLTTAKAYLEKLCTLYHFHEMSAIPRH